MTVRVEGEHAVVSTDDGTTSVIEGGAAAIRRATASAGRAVRGGLTAATHGTLAEAGRARPETIANPPALGDWPTLRRQRIVPRAVTAVDKAMAERRSARLLGRCHVDELGAVLRAVAHVTAVRTDPNGGQEPLRPVPSAGARHPIDVVVAARDVEGLDPGWWRFDPWRGDLAEVELSMGAAAYLHRLEKVTAAGAPPAGLVMVASFSRTLSRYPAGSTLVWRDAGVMAGYLHLSATSRGLGSCILSPVGVAFPAWTRDGVCDVGCVAVGLYDSSEPSL